MNKLEGVTIIKHPKGSVANIYFSDSTLNKCISSQDSSYSSKIKLYKSIEAIIRSNVKV